MLRGFLMQPEGRTGTGTGLAGLCAKVAGRTGASGERGRDEKGRARLDCA